MATRLVYIPYDLKSRMNQIPEKRIWSRVAQQAFKAECERRERFAAFTEHVIHNASRAQQVGK